MNQKDLTGQRFGRLVAMNRVDGSTWHCICDCGKTKDVPTYLLTHNQTRSCGCLAEQSRKKDFTGRRIGRLVAIEPTGRIIDHSIVWRFQCDCGNICEYTTEAVLYNGRHSCGCLEYETKAKQALEMQKSVERVEDTNINIIKSNTIAKNNTSGIRGVQWHKGTQKWVARIGFKKKIISLGYYDKIEDATHARKEAEEKYFKTFLNEYKSKKKPPED